MADSTIRAKVTNGFIDLGRGAVEKITIASFRGMPMPYDQIDDRNVLKLGAITGAIPQSVITFPNVVALVGIPRRYRDLVACAFWWSRDRQAQCLLLGDTITSLNVYDFDESVYKLVVNQKVGPPIFEGTNKSQ